MSARGAFAFAFVLVFAVGACGSRTELDTKRAPSSTSDANACGPSTFDVEVPITTPWTDTGIDVTAGTDVVIHASGTVRYGPNPPQTTDANGGNFDGQQFFSTTVFPNAVVCSLIGRIGDTAVPAGKSGDGAGFVGVDYHMKMTSSGRLFLGFNDQTTEFGDNSGAFTVTVMTTPPC